MKVFTGSSHELGSLTDNHASSPPARSNQFLRSTALKAAFSTFSLPTPSPVCVCVFVCVHEGVVHVTAGVAVNENCRQLPATSLP